MSEIHLKLCAKYYIRALCVSVCVLCEHVGLWGEMAQLLEGFQKDS